MQGVVLMRPPSHHLHVAVFIFHALGLELVPGASIPTVLQSNTVNMHPFNNQRVVDVDPLGCTNIYAYLVRQSN